MHGTASESQYFFFFWVSLWQYYLNQQLSCSNRCTYIWGTVTRWTENHAVSSTALMWPQQSQNSTDNYTKTPQIHQNIYTVIFTNTPIHKPSPIQVHTPTIEIISHRWQHSEILVVYYFCDMHMPAGFEFVQKLIWPIWGLPYKSRYFLPYFHTVFPNSWMSSQHQAQWKSTWGGSSWIGVLREIVKYIYFLSHRCWNWLDSPTHTVFSTLNLRNQIYTSKWYDNYNIVLHCGMYSGLIFSLRSSNFFLPFTCLCLFFWSVVIPRSLPLWTWLFSSLGALSVLVWVPVLPSGSTNYCLLVLAPWSWSSLAPGPGPSLLVPWLVWPRLHCIM